MATHGEAWDRRRIARYVLIATLAIVFLTTSFRSHDVLLRYDVAAGELHVTLLDEEGDRLRKTWFPGPPYEHTVPLAEGKYRVILTGPDGQNCTRSLSVVDEHPIVVEPCAD